MKTELSNHVGFTEDARPAKASIQEFPSDVLRLERPLETFRSPEVKASHPTEPDLFARHDGIHSHNQKLMSDGRIVMIGGGGLNSWAGVGLARSGAQTITVIDHDRVELANLSRQFFHEADLGHPIREPIQ